MFCVAVTIEAQTRREENAADAVLTPTIATIIKVAMLIAYMCS